MNLESIIKLQNVLDKISNGAGFDYSIMKDGIVVTIDEGEVVDTFCFPLEITFKPEPVRCRECALRNTNDCVMRNECDNCGEISDFTVDDAFCPYGLPKDKGVKQ